MTDATSRDYEVYLIASPDFWYVGSTTVGLRRRMRLHRTGNGHAPLLWEQIQHFGWDHFTVSVLDVGHGVPYIAEAEWYDRLLKSETRLNLNSNRPGGYPQHTPETRAKLSEQKRGKASPSRGVRMSDDTRRMMRASSHHAAKTHCPQGHPYDAENTRIKPSGARACRACGRAYHANRDPEAKAAKARRDVAVRRERYNTDPVYRAEILAYNKAHTRR